MKVAFGKLKPEKKRRGGKGSRRQSTDNGSTFKRPSKSNTVMSG